MSDRWDEIFSNDWIYLHWKSHIFKGLFKAPNCCQNCSRICKQCPDLQKNIYCLRIADIRGRSTTYQLLSVFITCQFLQFASQNLHSHFSTFPTPPPLFSFWPLRTPVTAEAHQRLHQLLMVSTDPLLGSKHHKGLFFLCSETDRFPLKLGFL